MTLTVGLSNFYEKVVYNLISLPLVTLRFQNVSMKVCQFIEGVLFSVEVINQLRNPSVVNSQDDRD